MLRKNEKIRTRMLGARRKGQAILLVIAAMPVVVGSLALVLDVGNLYFNKIEMQTASDSAVLAGGQYLPSYPSQAISTAENYAELNGINSSEIESCTVSPDDKEVLLTVTRTIPCYFCAVLGGSPAHAQVSSTSTSSSGTAVTTNATSGIVPIITASGVVPIGVDSHTQLDFGQEVVLKQGQVGAGNWGPLALGYPGGSTYEQNIEQGYSGQVTVNTWQYTETGNIVGPTQDGFSYREQEGESIDPDGTFDDHTLNDPRVMIVPLVNWGDINGKSQVPVMGFAMMWIVSVDQQGNITCYFIQQSVPNAVPDPNSTTTSSSTGATTPVLLQ